MATPNHHHPGAGQPAPDLDLLADFIEDAVRKEKENEVVPNVHPTQPPADHNQQQQHHQVHASQQVQTEMGVHGTPMSQQPLDRLVHASAAPSPAPIAAAPLPRTGHAQQHHSQQQQTQQQMIHEHIQNHNLDHMQQQHQHQPRLSDHLNNQHAPTAHMQQHSPHPAPLHRHGQHQTHHPRDHQQASQSLPHHGQQQHHHHHLQTHTQQRHQSQQQQQASLSGNNIKQDPHMTDTQHHQHSILDHSLQQHMAENQHHHPRLPDHHVQQSQMTLTDHQQPPNLADHQQEQHMEDQAQIVHQHQLADVVNEAVATASEAAPNEGHNEDGTGEDGEDGKAKRKRGPRKPKPPLTVNYVDDPKMPINPSTCAIVRAPRTSKNATQKYIKCIFMGKPEAFKKRNLLYKRYKERTLEVELLKHIVIEKEKDFKEQLDFWKKRVWELELFGGKKKATVAATQSSASAKPPASLPPAPPPVAAMPAPPPQHGHPMQQAHPSHHHHMGHHPPHHHQHHHGTLVATHNHHGGPTHNPHAPAHLQPPPPPPPPPQHMQNYMQPVPPPPPPQVDHQIDTVTLAGAAATTATEAAATAPQPVSVNLEGNFGRFGDKWKNMFAMLVEYKSKFGHCNVPKSYNPSSLHSWVRNQRNNYKNLLSGKGDSRDMNQARIDALNSLGFTWWLGRITKDDQWEANFQKLLEFKSVYGTFRVTKEYDKRLCRWVENQRLRKKMLEKFGEGKCKGMTWTRVDKLNSIGFTWSARDDPN